MSTPPTDAPTPETDALTKKYLAAHRDRNGSIADVVTQCLNDAIWNLANFERERDQARAIAKELKAALDAQEDFMELLKSEHRPGREVQISISDGLAKKRRVALEHAKEIGGAGWQTIETAPRDGTYVLIGYTNKIGNHIMFIATYNEVCRYWQEKGGIYNIHPTHWMPLPQPPKEGGEG